MPFVDFKPPKDIKVCKDPEHNIPGHIVLPPGTHTWECPSCGKKQIVHIPTVTL